MKSIKLIIFFFTFFFIFLSQKVLAKCSKDLEVIIKKSQYHYNSIVFEILNNGNKEIAIDEIGIKTHDDQLIKNKVNNIYDDNVLKGLIPVKVSGFGKLELYLDLSNVNPNIKKKYYYNCRYTDTFKNILEK